MSTHLTSDEIDLDGVRLIRSMFTNDDSRQGQMILALCNALERELRRNARLKEDMELRKPISYDGYDKKKGKA
jgi:hypothetical protein